MVFLYLNLETEPQLKGCRFVTPLKPSYNQPFGRTIESYYPGLDKVARTPDTKKVEWDCQVGVEKKTQVSGITIVC